MGLLGVMRKCGLMSCAEPDEPEGGGGAGAGGTRG